MVSQQKIAIVTTGRADYGLLKPLWDKLASSTVHSLTMIATGAHLVKPHLTVEQIEKDQIAPLLTVDLKLTGDNEEAICLGISEGIVGFSRIFSHQNFDLLIVLGDRYELLSVCTAALVYKIPIAHLHGGELTEGAVDDAIRHCVTKMSALHFVAHDSYRKRVIQLGEAPDRVFNVGAIGLDNFSAVEPISKKQLTGLTGLDFDKTVLLVTFHPETLETELSVNQQVDELFVALNALAYPVLATFSNTDTGGETVRIRFQQLAEQFPGRFCLINTLGISGYMAAMTFCSVMVGNSSSGILEAASFKLPVVNIGDRQKGRIRAANVLDVACRSSDIEQAVNRALSNEFSKALENLKNPFGDGHAVQKIVPLLDDFLAKGSKKLLKKQFYDVPFSVEKMD